MSAGSTKVNQFSEKRTAFLLLVHEKYDPPMINDIALIKLSSPFVLSWLINFARLPTSEVAKGQIVQVPGWGVTETGQDSNDLRFIEMPIINNSFCKRIFAKEKIKVARALCLEQSNNAACSGDSGTGYFDTTGTMVLGVHSFSVKDKNSSSKCKTNTMNGGVYIYSYLHWITKTMKRNLC